MFHYRRGETAPRLDGARAARVRHAEKSLAISGRACPVRTRPSPDLCAYRFTPIRLVVAILIADARNQFLESRLVLRLTHTDCARTLDIEIQSVAVAQLGSLGHRLRDAKSQTVTPFCDLRFHGCECIYNVYTLAWGESSPQAWGICCVSLGG